MAGIQKYSVFSNTYIFARGGVYICWEFHFPPRLQTFVETPVLVLIEISSFQAVFSIVNGYFEISSFQVVFSIVNGYFEIGSFQVVFSIVNDYFEIRFFGLFDWIFCIGF